MFILMKKSADGNKIVKYFYAWKELHELYKWSR